MERKNIKTANFIMWSGFCLLVISLILAPIIAFFTGVVNISDGGKTDPSVFYTIFGSFIGLSALLIAIGVFLKNKFKKLEIEQGGGESAGSNLVSDTGKTSLVIGVVMLLLGGLLYFAPSLGVLPLPAYMPFSIFGGRWIGLVLLGAGIILIVRKLILKYKAKKI